MVCLVVVFKNFSFPPKAPNTNKKRTYQSFLFGVFLTSNSHIAKRHQQHSFLGSKQHYYSTTTLTGKRAKTKDTKKKKKKMSSFTLSSASLNLASARTSLGGSKSVKRQGLQKGNAAGKRVAITTPRAMASTMVDDETGIKKMRDGIKEASAENLLTPRFYTTGAISFFFFFHKREVSERASECGEKKKKIWILEGGLSSFFFPSFLFLFSCFAT